jgi:hypothetical protein
MWKCNYPSRVTCVLKKIVIFTPFCFCLIKSLLYLTGKEYVCVVRLHDAVPSEAKLAQVSREGAGSLQEGLVMRLVVLTVMIDHLIVM